MPSTTCIFTRTPLSKDDVKLASLVPDKRYPHMDALKKIELKPDEDYTNNLDKNFSDRMSAESSSFFKLAITRLFSAELEKEASNTFHVTAEEGRIYELREPKKIFKKLCELDDVKQWLQDGYLDNQKTYFVIGYRTLLNAKLSRQEHHSTTASGKGNIPTGTLAGDPTPSDQMDVELAIGHKSKVDKEGEFETNGERIYAIGYRKVMLKFHQGIGTPYLKAGNIWETFTKTRGAAPAENEVIEADIEEEDESGVGQIETFKIESGEEIFIVLSDEEESEDEGYESESE